MVTEPHSVALIRSDELTNRAPYAYAAVAGNLVFTAGACPLDEQGKTAALGDIPGQTAVVMDNLETALRAAGAELTDVVKTTVYVASNNRQDLVAAWDVVSQRFGAHDAPSTLLGVVVLGYPDQLVEVEAIAVRKS